MFLYVYFYTIFFFIYVFVYLLLYVMNIAMIFLALPTTLTTTVGFHNYNFRIFNLRVSIPNKFIVDFFLTRCRISMCQGLGPKKHDEISEIDRSWIIRIWISEGLTQAYSCLKGVDFPRMNWIAPKSRLWILSPLDSWYVILD